MALFTAIVLAILTFIGVYLIWMKLPYIVKRFCVRHPLLTDFVSTGANYLGLSSISSSLVAAIACAIVGILISIGLYFSKDAYKDKKPPDSGP